MQPTLNRAPAPVTPEDLLAHSGWLRRLAGTLVRGDADADDLVQETFLAALRKPPLDDRPVRGWLTEVVRNAGRMRARTDGRRARREVEGAAAADRSAPSADVLLGRLSAQRRLSELVAELPEPLRATILLRYFEGLSAAEIARHQRVPAGTVRWRLKTGLDRLRGELDRESGGDRRRWCLLLAPLAGRKMGLGGIMNAIVKAAWAMGRAAKLLVAVVGVLAGIAGWLRFGPGRGEVSVAAMSAPAAKARRAGRVVLPGAAPRTLPDAVIERDLAAAHGAFEGRVINWSTGLGVPGAEVTFSIDGATSVATTDEDGNFELSPTRSGRSLLALVTAAGFLPFAPSFGHSSFELFARPGLRVRDLTVQLVPALDYTGVVLDPEGKPAAGATVTLLGAGQGERALHPIADRFVTDGRGEFQFHAPDHALLEARHPAFGAARGRMDNAALVSHRITIKLAARGAAELGGEKIAGRVVDAKGAPVAGAAIHASPIEHGPEWTQAPGQALTDAAGQFTVEGLDPGRYAVIASREGYATTTADAVAAGTADLMLDLRRGGTLEGRVLEAEGGAPLPSFTVNVTRREGPLKEVSVTFRSVVDAEGRFSVPDLGPGDYRLRATAYGHAPSTPVDVTLADPPAGWAPVELRLGRGGKLVGKLVETADGAPIAGARVSLEGGQEGSTAAPTVVNALSGADGAFELTGIPTSARSVMVGAYGHHMRIISGLRFEDGITTGPVTFDLTRTRDGEEPHLELAGVGATLSAEGDGLRIAKIIPGGGALDAGLAAGDTIVAVDGTPVATLGFDGSIQHIRGPEGSTVRLTVRKADGTMAEVVAARKRIQT